MNYYYNNYGGYDYSAGYDQYYDYNSGYYNHEDYVQTQAAKNRTKKKSDHQKKKNNSTDYTYAADHTDYREPLAPDYGCPTCGSYGPPRHPYQSEHSYYWPSCYSYPYSQQYSPYMPAPQQIWHSMSRYMIMDTYIRSLGRTSAMIGGHQKTLLERVDTDIKRTARNLLSDSSEESSSSYSTSSCGSSSSSDNSSDCSTCTSSGAYSRRFKDRHSSSSYLSTLSK